MMLGLRMGGAILVLGSLGMGGCKDDPAASPDTLNHCSDLLGDATCLGTYVGRPYCSLCEANNQGCVVVPPAPICRPNGGATSGDGSTSEASSGDSSGTTMAITTGVDSTTGEPPCDAEGQLDAACVDLDPARPFCIDATCVGCEVAGGDDFCGGRDSLTPACDTEAGDCVGCGAAEGWACGVAAPVCAASGECLACTVHAQCPGSACHLGPDDPQQGQCFAPEEVRWVDNEAPCPGLGTFEEPACSLQATAATIEPGDARVIRLRGGTPYAERAVFDGPMTIALIGDEGPVITGNPAQQAATLLFEDGVTAYMQGVAVDGNALTHGVMCNFSALRLEDSSVRNNDGWGIFDFDPCELEVVRTVISGNEAGGLRVSGGQLRLSNSSVARNGIGGNSTGVRIINAEAHILYSTIAGNDGTGADSIQCTSATGTLRNSILTGMNALSVALECFPLIMSHNALDSGNFAGGTNVEVGPYNPIYFTNPAQGDMRLTAPPLTPFGGVALWVEGDPVLDADGTPRPVNGSLGYAGVDQP